MIRIRHLVNSKHAEKHTRIPWPTSAGRTGSLLTRIFGNPHWCLRKIQTNSLHCEVLALLGVFWCLKDAVQITLIVLVAGLVTIAGGVAVPLGEWIVWGDLFFRGSSWWHGSHSWKTQPWTKRLQISASRSGQNSWSLHSPWTSFTGARLVQAPCSFGGGLQSVLLVRELIRERRPPEPEPVENEAQIRDVYTCDICIRD